MDYNTEFELYDRTHGHIEEIFNEMQKIFKIKQDEFNLIINEKDAQISELETTIKGLDDKIKEETDKNFKLLVQVEDLKNEVFILKDVKQENVKKKFIKANISKRNPILKRNMGRDVNYQMSRAKKSLDRSIGKIERVFNDNDPIKTELLDKMKNYK